MKALEDDSINVTEKLKFCLGRVENMVGNGENAGYRHFLLFPPMISKGVLYRVAERRDCMARHSDFQCLNDIGRVTLTENNERAQDSAGQDQTARM